MLAAADSERARDGLQMLETMFAAVVPTVNKKNQEIYDAHRKRLMDQIDQ